jgi:uncharacterized protein (DUF2126 family)/transglutaminase-like putative cysteine protease
MPIRVALHHVTTYRYDRPVTLGPQVVRLRPAPHCRTPIVSYSLAVEPTEHFLNWQQDPTGNYQARLAFPTATRHFQVAVELVADLAVINPFDFFVDASAEAFPFPYEAALRRELAPYLATEPVGPKLRAWLDHLPMHSDRTVDFLVDINRRLQRAVDYRIRMDPGIQSCEETLGLASGSCRDSAWLLTQVLRHLGLGARFVSGYLIQLTPDVKPLEGPPGPTKDFTDLHAWAEVYVPGAGWIGLDPTSGLLAGEGHIPLACAADPTNAAPITGMVDDCKVEFEHEMRVERVGAQRRSTRPYAPEEWTAIVALGDAIDARLAAGDVRLTMGGEPTFVAIDDPDGDEWNTAAMGPRKRRLAAALCRRLRTRFAPAGLLHTGLGKWYPGEPLPRWAFTCYWRRDGEPLWQHDELLAPDDDDLGHGAPQAQRFIETLALRLHVDPRTIAAGYEDSWYYLWRERRLPNNVDPFDARLEDPRERERLARVFEQGLAAVVGYALPLVRTGDGWVTSRWFLRSERMYLLPGDSPMGLRLPLDSLPWIEPDAHEHVGHPDPFGAAPELPARPAWPSQLFVPGAAPASGAGLREQVLVGAQAVGDPQARTALCVEPRGGRLHVFLPPQRAVEDYLALVAAVEDTALHLGIPVVVEGYTPPVDPRLCSLGVTPDPGVIEVNVHSAATWRDLATTADVLYAEARLLGLGTEKFELDGRHVGTGGGNHVALGGLTPADSPFLRRPDLLRSLLAYWHNHPALSFLFSGQFVGPTSQAPRVDQARDDSVHELELAFGEVERLATGNACPPWLVDRIFRHLLVDVTGNTHRAEFCIDKLYSPDGVSGRLGLLEMRAFEMPPHPQMSLVQQLLLRALVARFWTAPYTTPLVRWGTQLHDRTLLPHFVWADLLDVIRETAAAGMALQPEWFAPHFEFRFPAIGRLACDGVLLELRQAIEPWHVLGEEPGAGGTVRFVDSSLERIQVLMRGMVPSRHALLCNGQWVPLHPTGTAGEGVAAVRFRAWQPPHCLHPTIPVDAPLEFDVVDHWAGRVIARCAYHVAHPGGRHHEARPVNAGEAEARRDARFITLGHAREAALPPPRMLDTEFPFTLDLRPQPT